LDENPGRSAGSVVTGRDHVGFAAGEGTGERADDPRRWPHEIANPLGDARRDG
jgi:hypothetical protein